MSVPKGGHWIDRSRELADWIGRARGEPCVAVDTEFMRERTYWPRLCLVQLATSREAVVVDALAPGLDLGPLLELMADERVLKVFHAARQDLEIFHRLMGGRLPSPVFDTQIAAMVVGLGDAVSYESLVARLLGRKLEKGARVTDWSRRPLSEAQIRYALADVVHLRDVYDRLCERIRALGRESWMAEELAQLLDPARYRALPEEAWQRLKLRSKDRRYLGLVRELAAWRERRAQQRDVPRGHVLRDDLLLELASVRPQDASALRALDRIRLDPEAMREVLALIRKVMALPEDALPDPPPEPVRDGGPLVDLLKVLLKHCAREHRVAARLIATGEDLERIAQEPEPDVPALRGWRRTLFGDQALALKRGEIALALEGGRLVLLPRGSPKAA